MSLKTMDRRRGESSGLETGRPRCRGVRVDRAPWHTRAIEVRSPRRATGVAGMTDGRASTRRLPAPCARPARAGRRRARAAQGAASAHVMDGSTARCASAQRLDTPRSVPASASDETREALAATRPRQPRHDLDLPPRNRSRGDRRRCPRATCPDDVGQRRAATLSDRTARRERPGAPLRSDASRRMCRDPRRSRASSTAGASSVPAETLACSRGAEVSVRRV